MPGKKKTLRLHEKKKKELQILEANNINNILYIKHSWHNKYDTNKKKRKVNRVNLFGLGRSLERCCTSLMKIRVKLLIFFLLKKAVHLKPALQIHFLQ